MPTSPSAMLPRARERWILNPSDGRDMYHDTWKQNKQQEDERSRERMGFHTILSKWYISVRFSKKVKNTLGCHPFPAIVSSWREKYRKSITHKTSDGACGQNCWEGDNPNHLVVSTHFKNINNQLVSFPQVEVEMTNVWNHHLAWNPKPSILRVISYNLFFLGLRTFIFHGVGVQG